MGKFETMMSFVGNFKNLCTFIENTSKEIRSGLSSLNNCDWKEEEKVEKKSQVFFSNMEDLMSGLKSYNKKYQ